jgi:hypothetical protein
MADNDCVPDNTRMISAANVRKYATMADIINGIRRSDNISKEHSWRLS